MRCNSQSRATLGDGRVARSRQGTDGSRCGSTHQRRPGLEPRSGPSLRQRRHEPALDVDGRDPRPGAHRPRTHVAPGGRAGADRRSENTERAIPLIIVAAELVADQKEGLRYEFELAPQETLLTLASNYRIFQEKTIPEIVTLVLEEAGIASDRLDWRLQGSYQARRYLVQYGEVTWSFIERLLADEGISYWFDRRDEGPLLTFTDSIDGHDGLDQERTIQFNDTEGMVSTRVIKRLDVCEQIGFERFYLVDYDVRQPDLFIEGEEGESGLEYYEFSADIVRDEGTPRAKQRLQQLQRFKRYAEGTSSCIRLQPGRRLEMVGASDESLNGDYLVVAVTHRYERAGRSMQSAEGYNNRIRLVPAEGPHRPGFTEEFQGAGTRTRDHHWPFR